MQHSLADAIAPSPNRPKIWRDVKRYLTDAYLLPNDKHQMCTIEQRNNLYLLVDQVLAFDIPGDLVEFGCYDGQTSRVIACGAQHHGNARRFHVYDDFTVDLRGMGMARARFEHRFRAADLPLPEIHEGDLWETVPAQLPARIALLHIDIGMGGPPEPHARLVEHCLKHAYERMGPGSVGVLMDYHDPGRTVEGWDCNPGVKLACDRFFRNKPEVMQLLYGKEYSHAFFRKVW